MVDGVPVFVIVGDHSIDTAWPWWTYTTPRDWVTTPADAAARAPVQLRLPFDG